MDDGEVSFSELVSQLDYSMLVVTTALPALSGAGDSTLTFHRAKRIEPGHEP